MAGLGHATTLWRLPFHSYVNLRETYLRVLNPPKPEDEDVTETTVAPGVTLEERKRRD